MRRKKSVPVVKQPRLRIEPPARVSILNVVAGGTTRTAPASIVDRQNSVRAVDIPLDGVTGGVHQRGDVEVRIPQIVNTLVVACAVAVGVFAFAVVDPFLCCPYSRAVSYFFLCIPSIPFWFSF